MNGTGPQCLNTSTESGHRIKIHEAEVLVETPGYRGRLLREVIETKLHPDNVNRWEGFKFRRTWNPSISL
jgi:hypothetical protein